MTNLYRQFARLFAPDPLLVGTVVGANAAGVIVRLPDGSLIPARGTASGGQKVFVRGGAIEGTAPDLALVEVEV